MDGNEQNLSVGAWEAARDEIVVSYWMVIG